MLYYILIAFIFISTVSFCTDRAMSKPVTTGKLNTCVPNDGMSHFSLFSQLLLLQSGSKKMHQNNVLIEVFKLYKKYPTRNVFDID